jgi:thymidylate synthase (FAD)
MKVNVIATTAVCGYPRRWNPDGTSQETPSDILAEMAGRNCYQSWDRPNPKTATNRGYLKNILDQKHYSVLEHASVTFEVTGVSTALLGQLSRHRHFSLSVESARYVDKSANDIEIPEAIPVGDQDLNIILQNAALVAMDAYETITDRLIEKGLDRKHARQAARFILPQGIETKIIVTANLRAWREFLQKRLSPGADVEINNLASMILDKLLIIAPNTFQDFE